MPIDFSREQPINISVARKRYIPQIVGCPISPATSYRWIKRGVLAQDGTRVRLEAVKIGRTLMTTKESCERFLAELTQRSGIQPNINAVPAETSAKLLAEGLVPAETGSRSGRGPA